MELYAPIPSDVVAMSKGIYGCIKRYLEEGNVLDANMEDTMDLIFNSVGDPRCFVRFLMVEESPVGYFIGMISPEMFTGIPISVMIGGWAEKKYSAGFNMMKKEFESWSKSRGCKKVVIHLTPPTDFDRWERVLARQGYQPAERNYVKEL